MNNAVVTTNTVFILILFYLLLSFAAASQFVPSIIGGLFWNQGSARAALYSFSVGFALWGFTLILPALIKSGWLDQKILIEGLFGFLLFRPEQFLAVSVFNPLTYAMFWSLGLNSVCYILMSNWFPPTKEESATASEFVDIFRAKQSVVSKSDQSETIVIKRDIQKLKYIFTSLWTS